MSLVEVIAQVLSALSSKAADANGASPLNSARSTSSAGLSSVSDNALEAPSVYQNSNARSIRLSDYLSRWIRYAHSEPEILLISLIYLDRCCVSTGLAINKLNVHRLLLACLTLAAKWFHDKPYPNKHYAAVGGVTLPDLNRLERALFIDINFQLHVDPRQLKVYSKEFARPPAVSDDSPPTSLRRKHAPFKRYAIAQP
ncbi:Cyclin-U3-1 [Diplonema papillatum]|nr:Cyclin-U3-1 [Diplonema papillatum]